MINIEGLEDGIDCLETASDGLFIIPSFILCNTISMTGMAYDPHQIFSIGNSMICSNIWHKYHEWYFKILYVILRAFRRVKFETILKYH